MILAKAENKRKIWLLGLSLIMVAFCGSAAFALDPMGPPAADLQAGQLKAGVDYSKSTMDLELNEGIWVEYLDGIFLDVGEAVPFTLKDFKMNKAYFNFAYGAADNCEAFLRVGGTSATFGDSIWEDGERFDSNTDFAIGGGIKATFYEEDDLKIGGMLQVSWAEFDGKLKATHWAASDFVGIDIAETQIAIGATYRLTEHVSIYGGPFLHFISGELEDTFSEIDAGGGLLTSEYSWNVEQESVFGSYIGTQIELTEEFSFNIEYQHTSASDAFGAGLKWRF